MTSGGRGGGDFHTGPTGGPRRLLDEPVGDARSPTGWALSLLRRTPRYRPPLGRMQRVRLSLALGAKRRRTWFLRPAIAFAVLMGCGAVASAALGRWPALVSQAYHKLVASASAPPRPVEPRAGHSGAGRAVSARAPAASDDDVAAVGAAAAPMPAPLLEPVPAPAPAPPLAPASPPSASARADSTPTAIRHAALGSPRTYAPIREPIASARSRHAPASAAPEDTAPVLEAMRALRLEGNPARARGLLARYLVRHPHGALAEEALAMSIEAAVAHRDLDATSLARRYLRLYPAGHFSALARQTLDGGAAPAALERPRRQRLDEGRSP